MCDAQALLTFLLRNTRCRANQTTAAAIAGPYIEGSLNRTRTDSARRKAASQIGNLT